MCWRGSCSGELGFGWWLSLGITSKILVRKTNCRFEDNVFLLRTYYVSELFVSTRNHGWIGKSTNKNWKIVWRCCCSPLVSCHMANLQYACKYSPYRAVQVSHATTSQKAYRTEESHSVFTPNRYVIFTYIVFVESKVVLLSTRKMDGIFFFVVRSAS